MLITSWMVSSMIAVYNARVGLQLVDMMLVDLYYMLTVNPSLQIKDEVGCITSFLGKTYLEVSFYTKYIVTWIAI